MDELLTSITSLVNSALGTAGDLAASAGDVAIDSVNAVTAMYQRTYQAYLATGMAPADAADAAEKACRQYLRDVYGITVI